MTERGRGRARRSHSRTHTPAPRRPRIVPRDEEAANTARTKLDSRNSAAWSTWQMTPQVRLTKHVSANPQSLPSPVSPSHPPSLPRHFPLPLLSPPDLEVCAVVSLENKELEQTRWSPPSNRAWEQQIRIDLHQVHHTCHNLGSKVNDGDSPLRIESWRYPSTRVTLTLVLRLKLSAVYCTSN